MKVTVTDAKGQLTELVRRAEAGEEIVLTRHGKPVVRLTPAPPENLREQRAKALAAVLQTATGDAGPSAARSQDFLYDEDGLPR